MYQYFSIMGDQSMFDLFFTQQKNRQTQSTKIQEKRPQKSKRQLKLCHKNNYSPPNAFIIFSSVLRKLSDFKVEDGVSQKLIGISLALLSGASCKTITTFTLTRCVCASLRVVVAGRCPFSNQISKQFSS